ncbi:hypothetical protein GCM10027168_42830 [Streptomyces capparidis]
MHRFAGRLNAVTVSVTAPDPSSSTRNASSPRSGCPGSVPYAQPARRSSSRVHTTSHGADTRSGPTPSCGVTRTPGAARGASVTIRTPAARCIRHSSTARPAASNTARPCPTGTRTRRCRYPPGSGPSRVAPTSA